MLFLFSRESRWSNLCKNVSEPQYMLLATHTSSCHTCCHTQRKAQKESMRLVSQNSLCSLEYQCNSQVAWLLVPFLFYYFTLRLFAQGGSLSLLSLLTLWQTQTAYFVCHSYCVSFTHLLINCSFYSNVSAQKTLGTASTADKVYVNNTFDCTLYGKFYRHPGIRKNTIT